MSLKPFGFSNSKPTTEINTNGSITLEKVIVILFTLEVVLQIVVPEILRDWDLNQFNWAVIMFLNLLELVAAYAIPTRKWRVLASVAVLIKIGHLVFSYLHAFGNG